jgi:thiamine-phosphate diphosphorylase
VIPFALMLVIDPRERGVLEALAQLSERMRGDRLAVQLRAKDATDAALIAMARELAAVQPAMSRLIVNGRAAVARAIAADGVHLPEDAGVIRDARDALAAGALVGASVHDEVGAMRRAAEGADYLVLGPVGDVPGKPAIARASFAAIVARVGIPVLALGGIASEADADAALALGAAGIAVQRALLDPRGRDWLARRFG